MFLIDTITTSHYITELCIRYQIVHSKNSYRDRKRKLVLFSSVLNIEILQPQISINDFNILSTFFSTQLTTDFAAQKGETV